ncbi:MAG TPA: hypothetical protein VH724_14980, partial [Candidatus Angelobacter sp.]|nr:hypothetical protein [Candidatus Angelobacter sp.]
MKGLEKEEKQLEKSKGPKNSSKPINSAYRKPQAFLILQNINLSQIYVVLSTVFHCFLGSFGQPGLVDFAQFFRSQSNSRSSVSALAEKVLGAFKWPDKQVNPHSLESIPVLLLCLVQII